MAGEEITFSFKGSDWFYGDLQPLEWLEAFSHLLYERADGWDEWEPNLLEEHFEFCKEESPDMTRMEMYSDAVRLVTESGFHLTFMDDLGGFKCEIEAFRDSILKAFENNVIFPDILRAIGIIESVARLVEECLDMFWHELHYFIAGSPEEAQKYYGWKPGQKISLEPEDNLSSRTTPLEDRLVWSKTRRAAERYKDEAELTEDDYERAFGFLTEFCETMEKQRFSQRLRESAWAIEGYCRLKLGSKEYTETEERLAKRYEQAYRSYEYAEGKLLETGSKSVTDSQACDYLREYGFKGSDDYELPVNFKTWQRYVRRGRRKHSTQKNTARAGRVHGRSIIKSDEIQSISEISSQYPDEEK